MDKSIAEIAGRVDAFTTDIANIPQIKRGMVWCHRCGNQQQAGAECFSIGWPKCCGQTMSIDSGHPQIEHGPEVLQQTDGRSMSVGRKHNSRVREAEAALKGGVDE